MVGVVVVVAGLVVIGGYIGGGCGGCGGRVVEGEAGELSMWLTHRHPKTNTQTHTQIQTHKHTLTQTHRHTDTNTDTNTNTHTCLQNKPLGTCSYI